jgi:nucleoside-diphosphate-sugar epimerase
LKKKIVITGASSGIGRATALDLAREGHEMFLVARRVGRLETVAEECRSRGARNVFINRYDLSQKGAGHALVLEALERLGGLDVLICNAGYGYFGSICDFTSEQMERMMRVNYLSAFESIEAALPHFTEKKSGHIVLVSSVIGKKAMPFSAGYCATKFAQVGLGEAAWGGEHRVPRWAGVQHVPFAASRRDGLRASLGGRMSYVQLECMAILKLFCPVGMLPTTHPGGSVPVAGVGLAPWTRAWGAGCALY